MTEDDDGPIPVNPVLRLIAVVAPIEAKIHDRVDLDDRQARAANAAITEASIAGYLVGQADALGRVTDAFRKLGLSDFPEITPKIRIKNRDPWVEDDDDRGG